MFKPLTWLPLLLALAGVASAAEPIAADAPEAAVFALQAQVHAGDRIAMRHLLDLSADGAVAEYVSVIMGQAIRNHPDAFLDEVAKNWRAQCESCLESLLGNLGDDFVDRFPEQVEELQKRKKALRTVNASSTQSLRDRCILVLDRQISSIQSLIRQGVGAPMTPNTSLERTRAK